MAGNPNASPRDIIRVENLVKKFQNLTVLDSISVSFREHEVVSIIGPSGGGKSTFLRCLNLMEQPTSGSIFVDNVNICDKKININKHREKMGMVFQQFNLFNNMNVLKNLTAAPVKLKKMTEEEANERSATESVDS